MDDEKRLGALLDLATRSDGPQRNATMDCPEKQHLRKIYNLEAERFTAAVEDVNVSRGKTSKEAYDRLRAVVDDARNARNAARLALEQHRQTHGC